MVNDKIDYIKKGENLYAIIVYSEYSFSNKANFLTKPECPFQIGLMSWEKGQKIQEHLHLPVKRSVNETSEVFIFKRGKAKVSFYDEFKNHLEDKVVNEGDIVISLMGGHGFESLDKTEIIEIKQGPYFADLDKERFNALKK